MKRIFSAIKLLCISLLILGLFTAIASGGDSPNLIDFCIGFAASASFIVLSATRKPSKRNGFVANDFTEGLCVGIQTSLNNVFTKNDPSQARTNVGYLQAIKSPLNRAGFNETPLVDEEGKIYAVKVTGTTRGCEDEIDDTCTDLEDRTCIGDTQIAPWEDLVSDFMCMQSPAFLFKTSQFKKFCETTDDAYRARVINSYIDPMVRKLNKAMITIQNANFGNFFDGTAASHDVDLLNANGTPNFVGEAEILEYFEDLETYTKPFVIGSGKLGRYIRQVGIGCCNDGGINLAQAGNLNFYRDKYVEDILGADQFIGLQPGLVQLVTKNENVGQYVRNHEHYTNNTFVDPVTGLKFDIDVIYEPCKKHYFMQFRVQWMMYFLIAKARKACDELYNVNGSLKLKALQAA